jgi:exosortase H (IPTLxxWG-CTERM-specific)
MVRFFLVFLAVLFGLFFAQLTPWGQHFVVEPWTSSLARLCVAIVSTFDSQVVASGKIIRDAVTGSGISIEAGCNGLEAVIVLIAAMLAFPATAKARLFGIVIGFIAIQLLNVVRVISLFYLHDWHPAIFTFAHEYLWQALIMLDALIVWLVWLRYVARDLPPPNGPVPLAAA